MTALRVVDTSLAKRRTERRERSAELSLRLMLDIAEALTDACDKLSPTESLDVTLGAGVVRLALSVEGVAIHRSDVGEPWT
jgi:hypothetical protein